MYRALPGDLEELRALLIAQPPVEFDCQLDRIDPPFFGFALGAVIGVDPRVSKPSCDTSERQTFTLGRRLPGSQRSSRRGVSSEEGGGGQVAPVDDALPQAAHLGRGVQGAGHGFAARFANGLLTQRGLEGAFSDVHCWGCFDPLGMVAPSRE
jgi:hypothetical protein